MRVNVEQSLAGFEIAVSIKLHKTGINRRVDQNITGFLFYLCGCGSRLIFGRLFALRDICAIGSGIIFRAISRRLRRAFACRVGFRLRRGPIISLVIAGGSRCVQWVGRRIVLKSRFVFFGLLIKLGLHFFNGHRARRYGPVDIALNLHADAVGLKKPFRCLDGKPPMHQFGEQFAVGFDGDFGNAAANADGRRAGIKPHLSGPFGQNPADKPHRAFFNARPQIAAQLRRIENKTIDNDAGRRADIHARAVDKKNLRAATTAGLNQYIFIDIFTHGDGFHGFFHVAHNRLRNDRRRDTDFDARLSRADKRRVHQRQRRNHGN